MEEVRVCDLERVIKEKADECLKRKVRRKIEGKTGREIEPAWINNNIRREIKYRVKHVNCGPLKEFFSRKSPQFPFHWMNIKVLYTERSAISQ